MTKLTRRQFLQGCSLAIAAMAGARITRIGLAAPGEQAADADTLVFVFLRGGWDALNVLPPMEGDDRGHYEKARRGLRIPAADLLPVAAPFGLHPAMAPLHELYQDGKLALVHASGLDWDTRSHFDAQEFIEQGTPGQKSGTTGWLTRTLQGTGASGLFPAMATSGQPSSLMNYSATVAMSNPSDLSMWDNGLLESQTAALRRMFTGDTLAHLVGQRTLEAVDIVRPLQEQEYRPANGAQYPEDEFGTQMRTVAQMIKLDAGLKVAAVDFGGWDTHENQNYGSEGYMTSLLESLASGLAGFYLDLDSGYTDRLSVIVMSEFGRRLAQNESDGTDHGHGSVMFALGGAVNGGQVYGPWPGLANDQLYDRADLAVTTDYRAILAELLAARLGNPDLEAIFPGYAASYRPLGIFR
jgi:uncharacterized protein (DUF1501 family)